MAQFRNDDGYCYLTGRLAHSDVITLWPSREQLISADTQCIDCSGLDYIDSAGVAMLTQLVVKHQYAQLTFKMLPLQTKKLIDLYDLQAFFPEEAQ
ncbi:STAS domain-containing protein [Shewanella sp. Scap07]|uniref:STAS domain-containing protein n=1 Tax=Shewanella sp. Scap07 TaxID=2589987 RepID=UPI0015B86DFD|nr:STAS domain-containing protein [Shewanella sp. Scap07]QLE86941.1 STAS domain-containing protein [Shewanella sp. Scap07]